LESKPALWVQILVGVLQIQVTFEVTFEVNFRTRS
jgi:hypothetical protein